MRLLFIALAFFGCIQASAQTESLASNEVGFLSTAYITPKIVENIAYIGFWQNPDDPFEIELRSAVGVLLMETNSEEVAWNERGFQLPTNQLVSGVYTCKLLSDRGAVKLLRFRVAH